MSMYEAVLLAALSVCDHMPTVLITEATGELFRAHINKTVWEISLLVYGMRKYVPHFEG